MQQEALRLLAAECSTFFKIDFLVSTLDLDKNMKQIELTQNKVALVDDDDYEKTLGYNWIATSNAVNPDKYFGQTRIELNGKYKHISLHRLIFDVDDVNELLYFKDGNKLNCQRTNAFRVSKTQFTILANFDKFKQQKVFKVKYSTRDCTYSVSTKLYKKTVTSGKCATRSEAINKYKQAYINDYIEILKENDLLHVVNIEHHT